MGLAIVRRIIEFHGGRVWVQSELGVGSEFFFELKGGGWYADGYSHEKEGNGAKKNEDK